MRNIGNTVEYTFLYVGQIVGSLFYENPRLSLRAEGFLAFLHLGTGTQRSFTVLGVS